MLADLNDSSRADTSIERVFFRSIQDRESKAKAKAANHFIRFTQFAAAASVAAPRYGVALTKQGLQRDIKNLRGARDIVIRALRAKLFIHYPMERGAGFILHADTIRGFTRAGLARQIAHTYQMIYAEERRTSQLPEETIDQRISRTRGDWGKCCDAAATTALGQRQQPQVHVINRAETNGRYGIWGHVLADLILTDAWWDENRDAWRVSLDS